ncbi:LysR substrate-binding domain-containing protein [Shewanella waksmanii]|uniref:LysR family transcriptional regulator n=1 Tax=Shewanella waksmanii TaxID=213783 RepID=UPI003735FE65
MAIELSLIQTFLVIADSGSFTQAAEVLNCSRSHLSKQLNKLEKSMGVSLIMRTTRAQRLTEQGQLFYQECRQALNIIDAACAQAMDITNTPKGQIKINSVGGFIGEDIVAPLVSEFVKRYPDIEVELDFSSQRVDLLLDQFDFVFRMGSLPDSNLIARKLLTLNNETLASPDYLAQRGSLQHPRELKQHYCITGSIDHWHYQHRDNSELHAEVAISGGFKCKNGRAMIASALAGNGIVRLPTLYCPEELANRRLVPVFSDWKVADTPVYLVYHKDPHRALRFNMFANFVVEEFSHYVKN